MYVRVLFFMCDGRQLPVLDEMNVVLSILTSKIGVLTFVCQ